MDSVMEGHKENGHHIPAQTKMADMMMMQMTFYVGVDVTVLFEGWKVKTTTQLIFTLLFWFLLGFLYQGLKFFRKWLQKKCSCTEYTSLLSNKSGTSPTGPSLALHCVQTVLQVVQTVLSYFLMLVVMTYNVWLCLAVVVGDALGYFIFCRHDASFEDHCDHCSV